MSEYIQFKTGTWVVTEGHPDKCCQLLGMYATLARAQFAWPMAEVIP